MVLAVALCLIVLAATGLYLWRHSCVRTEQRWVDGSTSFLPMGSDGNVIPVYTPPSIQEVCVERAP